MYILYRYLIKSYLKIFSLSTLGFISILLITRIKDIAKFLALTHSPLKVLLYTLYQMPHILPFAIPISCLLSSFILMQKLSKSFELTAMRSFGLSIKKIIFPILLLSLFISFCNFFITSELTPFCRISTRKIASSEILLNPIMLMEKQNLLKIRNSYIDISPKKNKKSAKNFLFITINEGLNCILAKKLKLEKDTLIGEDVSVISYFKNSNNFDDLVLENQALIQTDANILSKYMKPTTFKLNPLHLPTKMLLARSYFNRQNNDKHYVSSKVEIARRIALSFSAFSLTFIGLCFGISIEKNLSKKNLFLASTSCLIILISFTIGKSFKYHPNLVISIYTLPQIFTIFFAGKTLKKTRNN